MGFFQKLFKKLQDPWNILSKKGEKQDKFVIYLLLIEIFIIILIVGIVIAKENLEIKANLAVALGTISMALAIVYIEIIKPWLQKPEIKIEFKDKDPYCRHEKEKEEEKGPGPYWCHFVVVNNGGSQADDCEAVVEKIWDSNGEKDDSKWPERESWIPVNLKWSAEKFFRRRYYKTIYPGGRRYFCDIGRVNKKTERKPDNDKKFAFELSRPFISQDNFLLPKPGIYKIQISVYSKNAVHKTKKFIVTWRGGWRKTQPKMQKRLEIKRPRGLKKW